MAENNNKPQVRVASIEVELGIEIYGIMRKKKTERFLYENI